MAKQEVRQSDAQYANYVKSVKAQHATATKPAKPTRKRGTMTQEDVVKAAISIIAEKGVAACSMRALGSKLNVSAMAIYGYYNSHEALMNAVCEELLKLADTEPISGEHWEDTLYRIMFSLYDLCQARPYVADVMNLPEVGAGLEPYMMRVRKRFLEQGMPEPIAIQMIAIVDSFAAGFMFRLRQRVLNKDESKPVERESRVKGLLTGGGTARPDKRWERSVRASYGERSFENGLFIIAEGVRQAASPEPCDWSTPHFETAPSGFQF